MRELPGGEWSEIEFLTVHLDAYDWPGDPAVVIGGGGVVHAFWYQSFLDEGWQTGGEAMFYKTRDDGGWTDRSAILVGHVGTWNDIALDAEGEPVLVWSEDVEGNREILAAVPGGRGRPVVAIPT